jgi:predicted nicotinamide N-methyase
MNAEGAAEANLIRHIRAQFFQHVARRYFSLDPPGYDTSTLKEVWQRPSLQRLLLQDVFTCQKWHMPENYTTSILRLVIRKLESENAELQDTLVELYTSLMVRSPAQHSYIPQSSAEQAVDIHYLFSENDALTLSECPDLLAAHGTTGFRTWPAALALGEYLLDNRSFVRGKRLLELGAGTGFLSLLCARTGSAQVHCTDGSVQMLDLIQRNAQRNNIEQEASLLQFGTGSEIEQLPVDIILGADITYEAAIVIDLASTLSALLRASPAAEALIAATVRQETT